jgi:1,4-dihydroxy-2-naphthoate octaprenyltransferase
MSKVKSYGELVKTLAGTSKIPFLLLTLVCVFLAYATVRYDNYHIEKVLVLLVTIGALAAHTAVNVLNEYFDFKSGLDFKTEKTAFSGGSGALQKRPDRARISLLFAILNVVTVIVIGIFFLKLRGWILLIPVTTGILLMILYSPFIVKMPMLCLCAPGMGFGFSMVMGTYIALTGRLSLTAVTVSLFLFCLVNNLLLLNQIPDCEADRCFGRKNIVILSGKKNAIMVYRAFMACTIFFVISACFFKIIPLMSFIGIIPVIFAMIKVQYSKFTKEKEIGSVLGVNVLTVLSFPVLIALGMIFQ